MTTRAPGSTLKKTLRDSSSVPATAYIPTEGSKWSTKKIIGYGKSKRLFVSRMVDRGPPPNMPAQVAAILSIPWDAQYMLNPTDVLYQPHSDLDLWIRTPRKTMRILTAHLLMCGAEMDSDGDVFVDVKGDAARFSHTVRDFLVVPSIVFLKDPYRVNKGGIYKMFHNLNKPNSDRGK